MGTKFSFKCNFCGEVHGGSPAFSYEAPTPYLNQSEEIQKAGILRPDVCGYEDEDGNHLFIRVVLEVPIHGVEDIFLWGAWVSLSETDFKRYVQTFDNPDPSESYFGWFSNSLAFYEDAYGLKCQVHLRLSNQRPYIVLEKTEHPLSIDYHNGISPLRAQEIAEFCMHNQG
ncbi:DUF2199 domain-containing protein [bacterium]|jgi:hypothetical protein|nr:DUF2199 domain-containing protein [bacterium]